MGLITLTISWQGRLINSLHFYAISTPSNNKALDH
jgi:hypothetical protein